METEIKQESSLEAIFGQLENIVKALEEEQVSLEDSFQLYQQGMDLLKKCNAKIDAVEKEILVLDENGDEHEF